MTNKPSILTDVYGKDAPAAAKFGVGARTLADVQKATGARRAVGQRDQLHDVGDVQGARKGPRPIGGCHAR